MIITEFEFGYGVEIIMNNGNKMTTKTYKKMVRLFREASIEFSLPVKLSGSAILQKIELLKTGFVFPGFFFLVFNIKTLRVSHSFGLEKGLGVRKNLEFKDWLSLIHPDYLESYVQWVIVMHKLSKEGRYKVVPLHYYYRIIIPIKHDNGKYYWTSQTASALQMDKNSNPISHLYLYHVMDEFENGNDKAIKATVWNGLGINEDWTFRLRELYRQGLMANFTRKQLDIIQLYRSGKSSDKICHLLKIKKTTLYKHNSNILGKLNKIAVTPYSSAKAFAELLSS